MVALALVFDHFSGYCMHKWWGLQLSLVGSIGLKKTVSHSCNPCWKTCLGSNDESRVPTIEYFPSKESRCNISVPSEKWLEEEIHFAKKCSSSGMTGGVQLSVQCQCRQKSDACSRGASTTRRRWKQFQKKRKIYIFHLNSLQIVQPRPKRVHPHSLFPLE